MEMQPDKDGMKTQKFYSDVGATAGCTLRLLLETIPCEKQGIKHGIHNDAWFGSILQVKLNIAGMRLFSK
jgi:hypothetical protein